MAIPKNTSSQISNTVKKPQKKTNYTPLIVIAVIVVTFIAWFMSDYWPWPSKNRINDRLEEVIDTCMYREDSFACKKIQKRYNMTFKYCKSYSDGISFDIFEKKPIYGVAWEGQSSAPPENKITINGQTMTNPFSGYYGCMDHR